MKYLVRVLLLLYICIFVDGIEQGALPFSCGDGSSFGAPLNCNIPPSYPKDRRMNENSIRIMQFNADSLFLEGCSSWNTFDPRIPSAKTSVGATKHLATIANAIYKLNADIIIIDEVCDCCVLRQLIRHMNRNRVSQTYQEYMLNTVEQNGEHIGIITRVDPIDIWDIDSAPKALPFKYDRSKGTEAEDRMKEEEAELPPPPQPLEEEEMIKRRRNRRLLDTEKTTTTTTQQPQKEQKETKQQPPKQKEEKKEQKEKEQKEETKQPPKEEKEPKETKPKRIIETEPTANPDNNFKHIAASFNLHLDKAVAIIGVQFADFAENNEKLRTSQAKNLAKFINLYSSQYHIIVVGDFNSVPEGHVLRRLEEDTGFKNIGYKYFGSNDFTFLDELSKGMLDNMFVSQAMYQKIQDTKIDYSHPKPIWPFSNHLPLIIDFDTTYFGGWGSPKIKPPKFKSIQKKQSIEDSASSDSDDIYGYLPYGDQMDADHTNYPPDKRVVIQDGSMVNIPAQDQMIEPPQPPFAAAAADIHNMDHETPQSQDPYLWVQKVLKWMIYALIGSVCLVCGVCFGWFFVSFWREYKGDVVHISRF